MWRVITEKWDATSRAAGKPATAPSAADTTGAVAIASMIERKRGGEKTGSPAGREPLPPEAQRFMADRAEAREVLEIGDASHVVGVSRPEEVADVILAAAAHVERLAQSQTAR